MTNNVRPECRKSLENMESDIKDIHDVVYKNGLIIQVRLNAEKIERLLSTVDRAIWLIVALIVGFLGDFIWGLVQGP